MREIKYQGWNGKQLLQVVRIHLDADGAIWWSNDFKQLKIYNAEHNPLREYSGLRDKNGKEIYEGDIINLQSDPDIPSEYNKRVAWNASNLAWNFNPPTGKQQITVIGNIYENSELLKGY